MATLGRIFNIQRFSIHDGPGIRTIVFFKGCPMRCAWCCNPESQSFEIEEMYEAGRLKTVGRDVSVADVMPEILADMPYYRRSGGGVTLSGGEVLCQSTFAAELLSECNAELGEECDRILKDFVESFGKSYREQQITLCEITASALDEQRKRMEKEYSARRKTVAALLAAVGGMIFIALL